LVLLVDRWARRRGGRAVALTVDHRLRRGSGVEARAVGQLLAPHGIAHHVLTRRGPPPTSNIQAAARDARYGLLGAWCRREGVLHLALAHHLNDQAETFLLRLGRGSGADGLACMPVESALHDLRLIRPLLDVPPERLRALLRRRGIGWIEDPSNQDKGFARVRVRAALPAFAAEGLAVERLAATAGNMGRVRAVLEQQTADLLARAAIVFPAGYCMLDDEILAAAPAELSLRALSRALMCIGANPYAPRLARLERLHDRIRNGALGGGATLAGCRILPRRNGFLITRERRAVGGDVPIGPGMDVVWDSRFRFRMAGEHKKNFSPWTIAALGANGWSHLLQLAPEIAETAAAEIPRAALSALPALFDRRGIAAVPHLGYRRPGRISAACTFRLAEFSPRYPLMGSVFAVV